MARTMAVYTAPRRSNITKIFRGIGLAVKLVFALGIGYAYLVVGFSL